MLIASRKYAFVLLAGLAFVAAGCGSNNKGKIVGKWKITGGGGIKDEELKMMETFGVNMILDFRDDGTIAMAVQSNNPDFQKAMEASKDKTSFTFKYRLGSGDVVELYDLPKELQEKDKKGGPGLFGSKDRAKAIIKIEGDNMTISDDDTLKSNPLKLTKMK